MALHIRRVSASHVRACCIVIHFFFFQAEDGIRDVAVTGVQTCALPICGGEVIYVGGYTSSPDFPVTALAAQPRLNGSTNGFLCAIEVRSGKLLYSTYLGGSGNDSVTAVSMTGDGRIYIAGTTNSERWPNVELAGFGN